MRDGGYVNTEYADNPTIEYFPTKGNQIGLNILAETLPCNLYVFQYCPSLNSAGLNTLNLMCLQIRPHMAPSLRQSPHPIKPQSRRIRLAKRSRITTSRYSSFRTSLSCIRCNCHASFDTGEQLDRYYFVLWWN